MIPASLLDHNSKYAVETSRQQRRDTTEIKPTEGGYTTSRLCSSDETCFKLTNVPTVCLFAATLSPFFLHHRPSKKAATQPSIATVPGFANSKTTGASLPSIPPPPFTSDVSTTAGVNTNRTQEPRNPRKAMYHVPTVRAVNSWTCTAQERECDPPSQVTSAASPQIGSRAPIPPVPIRPSLSVSPPFFFLSS